MPEVYAGATAIVAQAAGGVASGTLEVDVQAPAGFASGDLEVDRRALKAFISPVRLMRPEVYVGDMAAPVAEIVGTVEITETLDDLVIAASFTVANAAASPWASGLLVGNQPCRIELWVGPPGGVGTVNYTAADSIGLAGPAAPDFLDGLAHASVIGPGGLAKVALFEGYTDALSESAAFRPRAFVQALSLSSLWTDVVGCVKKDAFSGVTRAAILSEMAASLGITVTGLESLPSGRVLKPVDEMGLSLAGLIKRYGEIEGWRARLSRDGAGVEVLSEDTLLEGSPAFAFDESNTFNVAVSTPARPVTDWILSGTRIQVPTPEADPSNEGPRTVVTVTEGLDADGNLIRMVETVETFGGAERIRQTETFRTYAPDGDPPLGAAFQLTDRLRIVSEWADFVWYDNPAAHTGIHIRPAAQLSSRVTETWTFTSTPAAEEYATTYVWGGGRWLTAAEELTLIERITETYNWDVATCRLISSSRTVERPFSPRVDPDDPYFTYADGTLRAAEFYPMAEIERGTVSWVELDEAGSAPKTTMQEIHYSWTETPAPVTAGAFVDVYKQTDIGTVVWQGDLSGSEHTRTTTIVSLGAMNSTETETESGPVPGAPRGSTEQAAFQQEVILKIVRGSAASGYIRREESPSAIDFAESLEELETWARRRLRRDHSRTIVVSHRALPFLRVGDFVTVTSTSKGLDEVEGYVREIRRTINALNGGARQSTTIVAPPTWV